jgi:hypothetical protein
MKLAVVCESSADEAAIRILANAALGTKSTPIRMKSIRHRGWPGVRSDLPAILRELHFHTDADAVVVVVDPDDSVPHESQHPQPLSRELNCRFCELRDISARVLSQLKPRAHAPTIRIAIGLAVPAIEAWLLCDQNTNINETTWRQVLAKNSSRYDRPKLKVELYGTDRPDLPRATEVMVQRATELAAKLDLLQQRFPGGFVPMVEALRQT